MPVTTPATSAPVTDTMLSSASFIVRQLPVSASWSAGEASAMSLKGMDWEWYGIHAALAASPIPSSIFSKPFRWPVLDFTIVCCVSFCSGASQLDSRRKILTQLLKIGRKLCMRTFFHGAGAAFLKIWRGADEAYSWWLES